MKATLPKPLLDYWYDHTSAVHRPVYMQIDSQGRVLSYGGELARFGLGALKKNILVEEEAIFLTGLLPLKTQRMILPNLETAAGVFADLHLFKEKSAGTWVLLLDTTERESRLRAIIQKSNELQLKECRQRKLIEENIQGQILKKLNTAVFRILPENRFQVVGELPQWFADAMCRCGESESESESEIEGREPQPTQCFPFL